MKARASFAIATLAMAAVASAQYSGPADILVSYGGDVQTQVVPMTGAPGDYDTFYYINASNSTYLGFNYGWYNTVDLGTVNAGEVLLEFFNTATDTAFYTGSGSRNPDGDIHAVMTDLGGGMVRVDFEDLASYQGSDFNYGDGSLVVSGVHMDATPAPGALSVFGMSALAFLRRRRRA